MDGEKLDNAVPARIVRVLQGFDEEAYIVECKLPAERTATLVRALEFGDKEGDPLTFSVGLHQVPKDVVVSSQNLANAKFSRTALDRLKGLERGASRKLDINKSTGDFILQATTSIAKNEGSGNHTPTSISEFADLLESRVYQLAEKRAQLQKEAEQIKKDANKLEGNSLYVSLTHNGVGGTVQLMVKCSKRIGSRLLSEYRYSSNSKSGHFRQFFSSHCPLSRPVQADVTIFSRSKVPSFVPPKLEKAQVRVSQGRILLRNLKLGEPVAHPGHVPICQLQNVSLAPGHNLLPVLESSDPLRIRFEAVPEEEPGQVFVMGEIFNQWDHFLGSDHFGSDRGLDVSVYRNDAFVHTCHLARIFPGEKVFIPCGPEPSITLDLTTKTERDGKSEIGSHVAFIDVTHTVLVTADDICTVRVKLQLPKLVGAGGDPKALVIPTKKDFLVEENEDFVDPDTDSPTVHIIDDEVVILRIVASDGNETLSAASFSYRIQWQDNVVTTSRRGFGAPAPAPSTGGLFGATSAAPSPFGSLGPNSNLDPANQAGAFGSAAAQPGGGFSFGENKHEALRARYEAELARPAAVPLCAEEDDSGDKKPGTGAFGQQEVRPSKTEPNDESWVEASSLPSNKKYCSQLR